jgi:hypothetical protein
MSYSINWTLESQQTFDQNLEYLTGQWSNAVINEFLDRIDEVLQTITNNPYLFSIHKRSPEVRKCVINQRMILYFTIVDEYNIDLLSFWNTNQDPTKLK